MHILDEIGGGGGQSLHNYSVQHRHTDECRTKSRNNLELSADDIWSIDKHQCEDVHRKEPGFRRCRRFVSVR